MALEPSYSMRFQKKRKELYRTDCLLTCCAGDMVSFVERYELVGHRSTYGTTIPWTWDKIPTWAVASGGNYLDGIHGQLEQASKTRLRAIERTNSRWTNSAKKGQSAVANKKKQATTTMMMMLVNFILQERPSWFFFRKASQTNCQWLPRLRWLTIRCKWQPCSYRKNKNQ